MDENYTQYVGNLFQQRFLSSGICGELSKMKIYNELIHCLSKNEIIFIDEKKIYFNCFLSPSSEIKLQYDIPKESRLITFDINLFKNMPPEEAIAIILHELGHIFNGGNNEIEKELNADKFVLSHNYENHLLNSLETFRKSNPKEFDKEVTLIRIESIKKYISGKSKS